MKTDEVCDRPLETFGRHYRSWLLPQRRDFAPAGAPRGAFRSPPWPLRRALPPCFWAFVFAGQHSPELGKRCKDQKKGGQKTKKHAKNAWHSLL